MSRLAWERKEKQVGKKRKEMVEKKRTKPTKTKWTIKSMSRLIVWYFSNGWLFLPYTLLQVSVHRHGSCMMYRKTASITEHVTVVLATPYTTTMREGRGVCGGERWQSYNILAHITGKLVCISPCSAGHSRFVACRHRNRERRKNEMMEELRKTTEAIGWIYI